MKFLIFNNGMIKVKGMSGSDQRAWHWSRLWQKMGHDISLVVPLVGAKRYANQNFKLIITDKSKAVKSYFFTYLRRAWLAIKKLKHKTISPNTIIYASSDLVPDSIPALSLKWKNPEARLVCGVHLLASIKDSPWSLSTVPAKLYYFITQQIILKLLQKKADLVLVSNSLDKQKLLRKGFLPQQVLVTYGGVDFGLVPKTKGSKKYEAVWAGRLHLQKGLNHLFAVWQDVVTVLPQAKLLIIGENNMHDYFASQKQFSNIKNNMVWAGFISGRKFFAKMSRAKVFIYPSLYESFGLVVAEAMACGLPVVGYDIPVNQAVWRRGMKQVSAGNTKKMAQAVTKLLQNKAQRIKLGQAAQQFVRQFTWEKGAKKIKLIARKNYKFKNLMRFD